MKRVFSALILLLILLTGCNSEQPDPEVAPVMRISAILPHNDYFYWTRVAEGLIAADEELPVDVRIYIPDLNYNVSQMADLIRQQTAAQVDAVICQGIEDADYIAALNAARNAGIQVVLVDTDLEDFDAELYVGTDNYDAGIQMGKHLVQTTDGAANVAVLSGAPGYPNMDQRLQGIQDVIASYPDMQIVTVEYDRYDAMTVMEKYHTILDCYPQVDTLVCIEGTGGQTLAQFPSLEFDHVLAFDLGEETEMGLRNGVLDGLIKQQTHEMGRLCVEELYRWYSTGSYSSDCIFTGTQWITADTLDEEGGYEE